VCREAPLHIRRCRAGLRTGHAATPTPTRPSYLSHALTSEAGRMASEGDDVLYSYPIRTQTPKSKKASSRELA